MKISFVQPHIRTSPHNGFGYARQMCENTLEELGHDVVYLDPTADMEINFIQPNYAQWSGAPYRILYTPWESTAYHDLWIRLFNEVDEVWTPSPVQAQLMVEAGVKRPVYAYLHGVEPIWSPKYRSAEGTFEVLHVGMEALRKGANETIAACMSEIWDEDFRLTMKTNIPNFRLHNTSRIRLENERLPVEKLVKLFHDSSMLVSPSWGEGFGLPQLQGMATGMPVLITKGWAPYQHYLPEEFLIESSMAESPWQEQHPGMMWKPDVDDLNPKLRNIFENREKYNDIAYDIAHRVRRDFSWENVTRMAFDRFGK